MGKERLAKICSNLLRIVLTILVHHIILLPLIFVSHPTETVQELESWKCCIPT